MGRADTGIQSSFVMLHTFSMNGDSLWTQLHGNYFQIGWDIKVTDDDGFIITGGEQSQPSDNYMPFLIKTNSLGVLTSMPDKDHWYQVNIFPNPASDIVIFDTGGIKSGSILILNSTGKTYKILQITEEKTEWNCSNAESGIYFYSITTDGGIENGKLVINR